ncbi:MAG: ABC transporter permease [Spirochaetia bacterium]|jgi:simple sugar transport system permease protein|nr:ABC transporter permease [Spirochaetia bacterium]
MSRNLISGNSLPLRKYCDILSGFLIAGGAVFYLGSSFLGLIPLASGAALYLFIIFYFEGREKGAGAVKKHMSRLAVPVIGIVSAVFFGAIIMLLTGYDPVRSYAALFYGGFVKNWYVSVLNATPLIFTGLSIAFAFKAGLFNIGAEGQYYIGAMAGAWLGLTLDLSPLLSIMLIYIGGSFIASLWNFIPALLKVKTGAHEVITTMMFAHIARYLSPIFIRAFGGDPATSSHAYVTYEIPQSNWLLSFRAFIPDANYRLHTGILIAVATAFFVNYMLNNSKTGFEIRAVGFNRDAARVQGISIGKNIFIAMMAAGALAGMAGITQVLGLDHKLFENLQAGYGWNGISVALLASNHPIGVIFTSLLWGALDAGGQYMARTTNTPNSIVEIIKGIMLFLIVAKYIYIYAVKFIKKKRRGGNA